MRKTQLLILGFFLPLYLFIDVNCFAQLIVIKEGSPVSIDGIISANEWIDADSILIDLTLSQKVTVKFKHDTNNFNFLFCNNLESFNIRFPEILLDLNNDKSVTWMNDDWWFHVSATDCESNTAANDYSNCLLVQPDWLAANNFVTGPPYTDTVEIQIPFSKVNFTSSTTDTIGISFDVTNTFNAWNYWPDNLVNSSMPATWASAVVEFISSSLSDIQQTPSHIYISPNPVSDNLSIDLKNSKNNLHLILMRDLKGSIVYSSPKEIVFGSGIIIIPVSELPSGIYFLECKGDESTEIRKIVKL